MKREKSKPTDKEKPKTSFSKKPNEKRTFGDKKNSAPKRPFGQLNRSARAARDKFEPEPKDRNTVNALREKLRIIQEYKKLLAKDGLYADQQDKELESSLIKQLIRIEKGLPPTKKEVGRKSAKKKQDKSDDTELDAAADDSVEKPSKRPDRARPKPRRGAGRKADVRD